MSGSGEAVQVAVTSSSVLLRNSADPAGAILAFSHAQWRTFLARVKTGTYPEGDPEIVITIYLSDESSHEQVIAAIEEWLTNSGLQIEDQGSPVIGSWFNRLKARMIARDVAVTAAHAAEARLVLAQDAVNTATLGQIVAPIIGSLQYTQEAVIRIGALLIVKFDGTVVVHQLTADQQFKLDHQPQLARLPKEILSTLELE